VVAQDVLRMMSDLLIAVVAAVVGAVVGGFFTFVFGPLVKSRWIEPIQEQKRTRRKVALALRDYRNVGPDAPTSSADEYLSNRVTWCVGLGDRGGGMGRPQPPPTSVYAESRMRTSENSSSTKFVNKGKRKGRGC
jgi:hypothetical protein